MSMAVWAATNLFSRCSRRPNMCFLIDMWSPSALEPDKVRQLVFQNQAGFNGYYPSKSLMLSKRSPPITRRVRNSQHDVLNIPQESISASMSSNRFNIQQPLQHPARASGSWNRTVGKIGWGESSYREVHPDDGYRSKAGCCSGIHLWKAVGCSHGAY